MVWIFWNGERGWNFSHKISLLSASFPENIYILGGIMYTRSRWKSTGGYGLGRGYGGVPVVYWGGGEVGERL